MNEDIEEYIKERRRFFMATGDAMPNSFDAFIAWKKIRMLEEINDRMIEMNDKLSYVGVMVEQVNDTLRSR